MRRVLVTGIAGQTGSYLAELLLDEGAHVLGLSRDPARAREVLARWLGARADALDLLAGDLEDPASLRAALAEARPDELYHLAAYSSAAGAWREHERAVAVNAEGTRALLEALWRVAPGARCVHASSAALYGRPAESPQRETTPFAPVDPYGASKLGAHLAAVAAREAGLWVAIAILFNHESPRRPEGFVTRKVTRGAARIALGLAERLELGDLDARRDWGFAGDYADALRRIARAPEADDFVVATGRAHSVRELCALAFGTLGLDWRAHVLSSAEHRRPDEAPALVGDASKIRERLGWRPTTGFEELVRAMVEADLAELRAGQR